MIPGTGPTAEGTSPRGGVRRRSLHQSLRGHVVASRLLALQDRRLSGHRGEMILNGTYLVDDRSVEELHEAVDRLQDSHDQVRLVLAGPWPPYSFASLETP